MSPERLKSVQIGSALLGGVGLLAAFVFGEPRILFPIYLSSFFFWLGLALGSLALLMLQYQVESDWGLATRRLLEAAALTLPLLGALFLPVLFGMRTLYPWARPGECPPHLESYLTPTLFVVRAAVCFAVWSLGAGLLRRGSLELERTRDAKILLSLRRLSGAGLLLYALTMFSASVDWVLSTTPRWTSTVLGLIHLSGQALSAFALLALLLGLVPGAATPRLAGDLGNLLLTAVLLWAYLMFSQYLILWSENLPREISWVVDRSAPGWKTLAGLLLAFHFAVPFLALLFRAVKRRPVPLAALAGLLLAMRLIDSFWQILPAFQPEGPRLHWLDVAVPAGLGGLWIAAFLALLRKAPILANHDPLRLAELGEVSPHA